MQIKEMTGLAPTVRENLASWRENLAKKETVRDKALCGDIAFRVTPATADLIATKDAWELPIVVEVVTAAGQVHDWFTKSITTGVGVEDSSSAGTASLKSTTLAFVNGRALVTLKGDKQTWAAEETATVTVKAATIMGVTVAAKTHVTTVVADPDAEE